MVGERLDGVGLVVLGAYGEDDAAAGLFAGIVLQGEEGLAERAALAEHDAVHAVIADDAAPERVVEIEHQAFERTALAGGGDAGDELAVHGRGGEGDFLFGAVPEAGIVPGAQPIAGGAVVEREKVDSGGIGERTQRSVQAADEGGAGTRQAVLVGAEERRVNGQGGLLDHRTFEGFTGHFPAMGEVFGGLLEGGIGILGGQAGMDAGGEVGRVERQQDKAGLKGVQRGGRVGEFLPVLAVIVLVCVDPDAAAQAADADGREQVGEGGDTEHGEADGFGGEVGGRRTAEQRADGGVQRVGGGKVELGVGERNGLIPG